MKKTPSEHLRELCSLVAQLKNRAEARAFLQDILTPKELASVCERWQIVKLLARGKAHRAISKELNVSIDKVTRGAKALRKNHGGFRLFVK